MLGIIEKIMQARSVTSSWSGALRLLASRRSGAINAPMPGLSYRGTPVHARRCDWVSVQEVLIDNEYQIALTLLAGRDRPVVVDGGANIGAFGIYLMAHIPGVRIDAYEPSQDTFAILSVNAALRSTSDWTVHRGALWRECGSVQFEMRDWSTSRRIGEGGTESVPAMDIAKVLEHAGDTPIDLMKIDIEGAEAEFLMGQGESLRRVAHLLVELHPDRVDVRPLVAFLNEIYPHAYQASRAGSSKPVVIWTSRGDLNLPAYSAS